MFTLQVDLGLGQAGPEDGNCDTHNIWQTYDWLVTLLLKCSHSLTLTVVSVLQMKQTNWS